MKKIILFILVLFLVSSCTDNTHEHETTKNIRITYTVEQTNPNKEIENYTNIDNYESLISKIENVSKEID